MNDKKIVALIEPVGGHGGMDYYDYGLASALGRIGIRVIFCTSEETTTQIHPEVSTHTMFKKVWSTNNKIIRLFRYIVGLKKSLKLAKKEGCSIVHLQFFELSWLNLIVLIITRSKRMKTVVTLHDIESFHLRSSKLVDRLCANRIDELIVHNEICRELVLRKLNVKEVSVIPHGNYIGMLPECEEKSPSEKGLELLFFGQIKEVKGLDLLLEALASVAAEIPNIHLTIAGKPWKTDLQKYQDMIKSLGIENIVDTHFHYIPNAEVYDFYNRADLIVLPYRRIYQSGVLLMSMSMGQAVLASDLASFKEIIEDGRNGFLFEQGNADNLALKLRQINSQKQILSTVRRNALQNMRDDFNWDRIALQTEKVYLRLR